MLSLGQSNSCLLTWDEMWEDFVAGETLGLAAETETAQGLVPDSDCHRRQVGDPQLELPSDLSALVLPGWLSSESRLPRKRGKITK